MNEIATQPWLEGVRGTQVYPIINLDDDTIRVEAGPGTGKTFGLVRRVQRILHPQGLNIPGKEVLVAAFNRVIAKQLQQEIDERLETSSHNGKPVIRTVHALCLEVIGSHLRILLPHEQEAMIYDVLCDYPKLREKYKIHSNAEQAVTTRRITDKICNCGKLFNDGSDDIAHSLLANCLIFSSINLKAEISQIGLISM